MARHVTVTDHFGEGICVYEAVYDNEDSYCGDDLVKVGEAFDTWEEAEDWADLIAGKDEIYIL